MKRERERNSTQMIIGRKCPALQEYSPLYIFLFLSSYSAYIVLVVTIYRVAQNRVIKGDDDTGNIPQNSLTTVLDADDEQMLLVNAAGRSRIIGLNMSWVRGSQSSGC